MAAHINNKYALGNNGGRPPMYETPADLEKKVVEYFEECFKNKYYVTITGLVMFLGFADRQSLNDYSTRNKKKDEFAVIIKRARTAVAHAYELQLSEKDKPTGAIFALKNMGWADRQELTGKDGNEIITKLTVELVDSKAGQNGKAKTD